MSCYRPLKAWRTSGGVSFVERGDVLGSIELPCGQCIGCRMRRASDWELRVMHEASLWPDNCVVGLTYGRDCLPPNGSLYYPDFQSFMRRLRAHRVGRPVRFYMCGEYGEVHRRPHYHACLFNCSFPDMVPAGKSASGYVFYDSAELSSLWGHGRVSVQPLRKETASYVARYIMKKVLGDAAKSHYQSVNADGEIVELVPEFAHMSLRPGIGADWFKRYASDVYPLDGCVLDGSSRRVPRYYDKLAKKAGVDFDDIEYGRQLAARRAFADNTDERRRVREVVHEAKVRNLLRNGDVQE